MPSEQDYISFYRTAVEKKLMLGNGDGKMRQRDFEYLAKLIEDHSKVRLSLSTLKRLWKDDYTQEPHASTLDAMASVLGFNSWHSFKKDYQPEEVQVTSVNQSAPRSRPVVWPVAVTLIAVVIVAAFFILQGFNKSEKKLVLPENIEFKADKTVTSGVPNTVLFTYDVKGTEADSFFIQQSWNPLNKVRIDPANNYLSSIYYLPGFHRAKLIVNDSIVRKVKIHVKTDGWMPILQYDDRDNSPYYLDQRRIFRNGNMCLAAEDLVTANVDPSKKYLLRYYNVRDYDGVDSDNFSLETRLKHDSLATGICPFAELTIMTEEHIYWIPLTSKGCVGNLDIKLGEVEKRARDFNLSGLGTNIYQWQKLRIENKNKLVTVFLNDVQVVQLSYKKDFGKIVGLVYTFNGIGSVDYVNLADVNGTSIYHDDFEETTAAISQQ